MTDPANNSVEQSTALSQHQIIVSKIEELKERLLANHPQMPVLLREIHSTLKENPQCVTLLEEEHISIIVNGLEKQTNTYLAAALTKTSAAKTKALKNTKMSDLGFDD